MSPETYGLRHEDEDRHLRLRSGAWLVSPEDQAEYRRFASAYGPDRALVMLQDEEFVRHVRRTEAMDIEPLDGTQWVNCRTYAQMYNLNFDAVVRLTYRKLGKPLPERDEGPPPTPVQRPYSDDTSKPRTPDWDFAMPPPPKPKRMAADPWAPGFDDPRVAEAATKPATATPEAQRQPESPAGAPSGPGRRRTSEHPTKPLGPIVHTPAEKAATGWSADHDMARHNLLRRSQTPVGRHERMVRAKAARLFITDAMADQQTRHHPVGCPWQAKP